MDRASDLTSNVKSAAQRTPTPQGALLAVAALLLPWPFMYPHTPTNPLLVSLQEDPSQTSQQGSGAHSRTALVQTLSPGQSHFQHCVRSGLCRDLFYGCSQQPDLFLSFARVRKYMRRYNKQSPSRLWEERL